MASSWPPHRRGRTRTSPSRAEVDQQTVVLLYPSSIHQPVDVPIKPTGVSLPKTPSAPSPPESPNWFVGRWPMRSRFLGGSCRTGPSHRWSKQDPTKIEASTNHQEQLLGPAGAQSSDRQTRWHLRHRRLLELQQPRKISHSCVASCYANPSSGNSPLPSPRSFSGPALQ